MLYIRINAETALKMMYKISERPLKTVKEFPLLEFF